jgi:NTE family protein
VFNNKEYGAKNKENRLLSIYSVLFILFSIFYFLFSSPIYAQDSIKKPKIGLVLSGGGAKGLAHIGVLKVIDSLGIQIDYIGGTSMGAIVGGLYASGYSAKQLEYIFSQMNSNFLIQDYVPRNSKGFNQKKNDEMYVLTLPFNKFKVSSPTGLSKGMYNFNNLSRLTYPTRDITDFNKLTIPFFCIATDVENGEEVILRNGDLAQAMLASGALPTLYNPVEIDGKLLIDGGVKNNYPIEELIAMGAEYIIGVDVQEGLKTKDDLKGVTDVLLQISSFPSNQEMENKIKLTNLYLKPNIKNYNILSFEDGKKIIKNGENSARENLNTLQNLPKRIENIKNDLKPADSIYVKEIQINELKNYTRSYVLGKTNLKPNEWISYKNFEKGINSLNASENFKSILYSFNENNDLILSLVENPTNTFVKFGIHYDELYKSGFLLNLTQKKILTKNDVASLDVIIGDNFRYNFDYYIDNGFYWSFGVNSKLNTFNKNIKNDFNNGLILDTFNINSINIDFSDFSNSIYFETFFSKKFLIGTGLELKHLKIQSQTLQNVNPVFENSDYLSVLGYLKYDSFDKKHFPKKGWFLNGEIKSFLYSTDFTNEFKRFSTIKADVGIVKTFYKKTIIKLLSEFGSAVGERSIPFFDFVLGGYGFNKINNFQHFLGYDFLSISGNSYIKASATLQHEIFKKNYLSLTANYANIGNKIFETDLWVSRPQFSGYGIGYGIESIIGPLEITHSWSPETKTHFTWFSIGYWF